MKKLLFHILTLLPMVAWAENLERIYINGLYYNLYEDENGDNWARVTSKSYGNNNGTAYYGDIIIPSQVIYNGKSYNVTRIDCGAFRNCKEITSIKLPESVTHIEEEAFKGCSGLNTINIPSSVVHIDDGAFNGIGWYNNQPDGILYLDNWIIGFKGEKPTGNITIAEGTKGIANLAFWNCDYLTNITIPNSVAYIGSRVFEGCSSLISINIPNGVTRIEGGTFYGCSSLTTVTIPNSVTIIESSVRGYGAFGRCSGLTSVTFGNSLTIIGGEAFSGCTGLVTVSIPNQVTSIGSYAFCGCTGLTTITIPSSVNTIGYYAFDDCRNLNSVHISDIEAWCKISFTSEKSNPLSYAHHLYHGEEEIKDLVIPNSVESIGDYTFDGCIGLKSVTFPNSVTRIGNYPFSGCSGLTSVSIPNSVTNIGIFAFANCNLTSVDIPNSVTTVGESAFEGCWNMKTLKLPDELQIIRKSTFKGCNSLKSVTIPTTVEFIYQEAFANCYGLENVNALPSNPPFLYDNSFSDFSVPLKVPKGCKEAYQTAQGWKNFTNISDADKYKLTYVVDGEEYKSYELEEGETITIESAPSKDGYSFSGWDEIPETMPADDVTITGTFTINKYKLTYMLDGQEYKSLEIEYNSPITPEADPTIDGYDFLGWSEIPETMPSHDVIVTGSFERRYDIGSVTSLIGFILRGNGGNEDIAIYDMNGNGVLDVGDLVLVVRKVLNSTKRSAATRADVDCLTPDLSQYSAAQFVLNVPVDVREQDIQLVKSLQQTHQMMCKQIEPGAYAVVIYSLTNNMLTSEDGSIIEVNAGKTHASDLSIQDVMLAKPTGETKRFDNMPVVTVISDVKGKTEHRKVYDLKGQKRNRVEGLQKGVYVENGKKIVVR